MNKEIVPADQIASRIRNFHGEKVLLDFDSIRQWMAPPDRARREIGFHVREKAPRYRARKRA